MGVCWSVHTWIWYSPYLWTNNKKKKSQSQWFNDPVTVVPQRKVKCRFRILMMTIFFLGWTVSLTSVLSTLTLSLTPSLLPFIWVFLSVFSSIPRADRWDSSLLSLRFFVCLISLALCCAFVLRSFSQIQCQVSLSVLNKSFSLFFTLFLPGGD